MSGPVKIGYAEDPEKRLLELQTGNPEKLYIFAVFDGGFAKEKSLHKEFDSHRIRGEWFRPVKRILTLTQDEINTIHQHSIIKKLPECVLCHKPFEPKSRTQRHCESCASMKRQNRFSNEIGDIIGCCDCGTKFVRTGFSQIRCKDCQSIRKRRLQTERQRRWRSKLKEGDAI